MSHTRTLQGKHGLKGGKSGNCVEAKIGGKLGGGYGAQGGSKSKGVRKKELTFLQCLRLYEIYLAYDLLDEESSVFKSFPIRAKLCLKEMC